MDATTMLKTAVVLLALTGAGGLVMAGIRFAGKPRPPTWIALLHGLLAGSGITLVMYAAIATGLPPAAWPALALLAIAALGGLVLNLGYHWRERALPVGLVLLHAGVAVVGLVVLAIAVWK